jgi:hypothetical protein
MRDHIRREADAYEISAAWFIVPMSVTAAVLIAMGAMGHDAETGTPAQPAPAIIAPAVAQPASAALPVSEPLPEAVGHVQAF